MSRRRSKRRGGARQRAERAPILIVTQGTVTEVEYFTSLRATERIPNLTIKSEPQSPEKIVKKSLRTLQQGGDAPYSHVFFVVDVDDTQDHQFHQAFKHARNASSRHTTCSFVVSNECFEVWLLAHFEDIRGNNISRASLPLKLEKYDVMSSSGAKHVSESFPVKEYKRALQNCNHAALDSVGPPNSTAVPEILKTIGLI